MVARSIFSLCIAPPPPLLAARARRGALRRGRRHQVGGSRHALDEAAAERPRLAGGRVGEPAALPGPAPLLAVEQLDLHAVGRDREPTRLRRPPRGHLDEHLPPPPPRPPRAA